MDPLTVYFMSLSDSIDYDAFETAHQLTLANTPEHQLNAEFISKFTRLLISELYRVGVEEVRSDRERSTTKIQAALEDIRQQKGDKWNIIIYHKTALRMALEHSLAARTTFSEMPQSIKRITKKFSIIPPAEPLKEE